MLHTHKVPGSIPGGNFFSYLFQLLLNKSTYTYILLRFASCLAHPPQSLQEVLSTDPDEARRKMADQSRKITLLIVNEKTMTRKLALVTEAEKQLRKVHGLV